MSAGVAAVIVCAAIPPFLVGALAPRLAADFIFDTARLGLAVAGYYLVSGVLSPLGGRLVDRLGPTLTFRVAAATTTVGLLAIAAAQSAMHVGIALTLLGLPNSLVQPAANRMLSEVSAPRARALAFGVVQAAIPTATLVAGAVLAVASYGSSWRWTVLAVGGFTVAVQLVVPRVTRDVGLSPKPRPEVVPAPAPYNDPRLMVALVATGFFASAAATSLPSFIASTGLALGLSALSVSTAQVLGSLACILLRIVAPLLSSHSSLALRCGMVSVLLALGVGGYLGLASGTAAGFLLGAVVAYACGWGWNGLFNLVVVGVRPGGIAAATGKTQGGVFLGGLVGPLLFATIARDGNYGAAWLALSAGVVVAVGSSTYAALVCHRARIRSAVTIQAPVRPTVTTPLEESHP